ncbi:MAG: sigma-70 family RNA polymerase sigma factor [Oscillospiraceae bacterium]
MNNKHVIYINNQPISVSAEVYKEYWKSIEHERYLTKQIRKTWVYLDHLFDEYENNTLEIQLIEDLDPTRNEALKMEQYETLYKAINKLNPDEIDLINAIFFENKTDDEYATEKGVNQSSITRKKAKILSKLREIIEIS